MAKFLRSKNLGISDSITYGFGYERTQITVAGTLVELASGEELIQLRVRDQAPYLHGRFKHGINRSPQIEWEHQKHIETFYL